MAIDGNTHTAASAPPVVPTQEELTTTIVVLLAIPEAAAQSDALSTNKLTFSAVIDPYLESINLNTREGINTYKKMIKPDQDWICQTLSVKTATHLMDLFKDKEIQYGLDEIFRVPKSGTGVVDVNPRTLPGSEVYNFNLADFTNLLEAYQQLTDEQVMNFSGWIYGDEIHKLEKLTDMVVKATDTNTEENQGMANCLKIRLHIISGMCTQCLRTM